MSSLRVNAWILASTTSQARRSMQLCKLHKTVSSSNCLEQAPPLAPLEHPQPLGKNFSAFSINWFSLSSFSKFNSTSPEACELSHVLLCTFGFRDNSPSVKGALWPLYY